MSGDPIDVKLSGSWPEANADMTEAFEKIADVMFRSVQQNFIVGGRPTAWPPLSAYGVDGAQASHLMQSGNLFENIQLEWDRQSATVGIDTVRVPYAAIHNFGGVIQHPGSKKFQAFEYNGGMVFTWGTKAHAIPMPQRQFMMFQEEDRTEILGIYGDAIFTEATLIQ